MSGLSETQIGRPSSFAAFVPNFIMMEGADAPAAVDLLAALDDHLHSVGDDALHALGAVVGGDDELVGILRALVPS